MKQKRVGVMTTRYPALTVLLFVLLATIPVHRRDTCFLLQGIPFG
jgi:hypothetical protein